MGLIKENINIRKNIPNEWVLASPLSSIVVNDELYKLFKILEGSDSLDIAHKSFNSYYNSSLSIDEFDCIVKQHFGGRGFLLNDNTIKQKSSYLSYKINLISKRRGIIISKYLEFLFHKRALYFLSLIVFLTIFSMIYIYHSYSDKYKFVDLFYGFLAVNISLLFHEFGHITAYNYFIKKYNIKKHDTSGQIGFGFYFIFPVYYSNITQAWSLNKISRIIINFAGVYFQLLIVFILLVLILLFNISWLIVPAYSIVLYSLFNLNPFIRSDGYWILSDLSNTHNLIQKSKLELNIFLHSLDFKKLNWKVLYSIGNYILFVVLTINIIVVAKFDLLYFPINFIKTLYNLFSFNFGKLEFNTIWIYYLGFYIIIFRFLLKTKNVFRKK